MDGRVPTFLVNVDGVAAEDVAARLAAAQIGVWAHDSWYSLDLYRRLGYADKSVRIGFIHYNTEEEVDRLLDALDRAAAGPGAGPHAGPGSRPAGTGRYPAAPLRISESLSG
jgi:selenocysteine lyase/cysteine desulfurase